MAETSFEYRLQRLFNETPAFEDAAEFTTRVEGRLDRGWTARRLAIGVAGLVGGGVAVAQTLGSDLFGRLELAGQASAGIAGRGVGGLFQSASALSPMLQVVPIGGEVLWLVAGLGALAIALLATRLMEQW